MNNCVTKECMHRQLHGNGTECACENCLTYIPEGTVLREINFNKIGKASFGLSIFLGERKIADGFIGDVLKQVTELADCKVKSCNFFFREFVIRLEE